MDADRARPIAEHAHAGDRDSEGSAVLAHLGRIVRATPAEAHAIAWLHEVLERGALTEHELLAANLSSDELRTLRLVTPPFWARSDREYLGHVDLIARAAGQPGRPARAVKAADLRDGCVHPRITDSWSPPYAVGLRHLRAARGAASAATPLSAPADGAPASSIVRVKRMCRPMRRHGRVPARTAS